MVLYLLSESSLTAKSKLEEFCFMFQIKKSLEFHLHVPAAALLWPSESSSSGVPGPVRPSGSVLTGPVLPSQRLRLGSFLYLHIVTVETFPLPASPSSHFLGSTGQPQEAPCGGRGGAASPQSDVKNSWTELDWAGFPQETHHLSDKRWTDWNRTLVPVCSYNEVRVNIVKNCLLTGRINKVGIDQKYIFLNVMFNFSVHH